MNNEILSKMRSFGACALAACALLLVGCKPLADTADTNKTYWVYLYNSGPETSTAIIAEQVATGDTYTLPNPTREFYAFTGWNSKYDGSGTPHAAGEAITVSSKITLYGQWTLDNTSMTMTDAKYAAFCEGRNAYDKPESVTIKINVPLPSAEYMSAATHHLTVALDLSACTALSVIDDAYEFTSSLVGIVFPSTLTVIDAYAFYNCPFLESASFIDTASKWYRYQRNQWDTVNDKPTSALSIDGPNMNLDTSQPATTATKLKRTEYFWSTTKYAEDD